MARVRWSRQAERTIRRKNMLFRVFKEGMIKVLAEELEYDTALSRAFADRWRVKKLEKRVEELEKKLEIEPPKRSRFVVDDDE